ncbi:MAG TPA: hypothetical protein PKI62_11190 [bacterium]|nr:hypothetical protein [bacterium]
MILLAGCGKRESIPVPVYLPLSEGSQIKYVSYVTDSLRRIQHAMEYFPRYYLRSDSSTAIKRHFYIENNKLNSYSVDPQGRITTHVAVDLATYAAAAGFPYRAPVPFAYPRQVFSKEKGFGTTWSARADTQFTVLDTASQPRTLEFGYRGEARLAGWAEITVPASKFEKLHVLDVHWPRLVNYLIDHDSGDTLWVQHGAGHEYFDPRFGLARSTSDYTVHKKGEAPVYRQSTLDLYLMLIPAK